MATLVLGVVGSAVGGALLPGGVSVLGATITGAAIGGAVGSVAGAFIDQALFAPLASSSGQTRIEQGPRLFDLKLGASSEGVSLPRVYGRARLPGQLIWATRFQEDVITTTQTTGGGAQTKGGKNLFDSPSRPPAASQTAQTVQTVEYRYYANAAYAICEGPITRIGRIWADGQELDHSGFVIRIYRGDEHQTSDGLIAAKEGGADLAPAYRGTAYVVFEHLPLAQFGNRLPQLNFEVFRAVDDFEKLVRAVNLIPSAGEFVYENERVIRIENGRTIAENRHTALGGNDWKVALDQLKDQLPNAGDVSLVVSWFGTDLRIGACQVRPGVEVPAKQTQPYAWSVGGVAREQAHVVSQVGGRPAYGGTPADRAVVSAIKDLKARGLRVTFYPFISMDVPEGNALPDPYTGGSGQPLYPWRGRITCIPAPGEDGTVDKTSTCATQVASFVGECEVSNFAIAGNTVLYSGPAEWSFRRFILHYAHLCKAAGGVDAFIIGSEMRGATSLRSSASDFPFVAALVALAQDVRTVLGSGTKITYAADWTEHRGYQPQDGTGDVYFHLDPLWASSAIDAVGIDVYWPLSDWRDGEAHLDRQAGWRSIYDLDYLRSNIRGGEGFDWYYPSAGLTGNEASPERIAQTRLPITDGAHGKPWIYKPKAILEWWQNQHFNRPGGVEQGTPTGWVPQSKPIWFTEVGCPAVDKGSNQPNVFIDPKSSESFAPYFSRSVRDDLIQRRYISAIYTYFDPNHEDFVPGSNPVSSVYGGRMVDIGRIFVYTWDARPFPAFPYALSVWADGGNWELGHWLTGRVGGGALAAVVRQILEDYGFTRYQVTRLYGFLDGFVIDRIMSAREALQPLSLAYLFDAYESSGLIQFAHRGLIGSLASVEPDDLVETGAEAPLYTLTRGQETELPLAAKLTYIDGSNDYAQAAVEARRLGVQSDRVSAAELPIVLGQGMAQTIAENWLQDSWAARERATFGLPPSGLAFEPGDVITLEAGDRSYPLRIVETRDGYYKEIEARSVEPFSFDALPVPERPRTFDVVTVYGPTAAYFLDLPLLRGDEPPQTGYITANANPWPGAVAVFRSPTTSGFELNTVLAARPTLGQTVFGFWSGPLYRYDKSNVLRVKLDFGALASVTEEALLNGANYAAIQNADGEWELIQFQIAELVAPATYDLSMLLRGQNGTERAMRDPVSPGARFIVVNSAVTPVSLRPDEVGLALNYRYGPASESLDEESYGSASHAFRGLGLRPLSPVHLQGKRDPVTSDWTLLWKRRTRVGGDSWEGLEVPLAEERELYRLDILAAPGGAVLRSIEVETPLFHYTEAMQIEDFSEAVWNVPIRVAQISPIYGPGVASEFLTYDYQH
ncbi:MAG: baseplate multidomain protein megatron [Methyloceanibacter sp.]